jgi:hypothetical protein
MSHDKPWWLIIGWARSCCDYDQVVDTSLITTVFLLDVVNVVLETLSNLHRAWYIQRNYQLIALKCVYHVFPLTLDSSMIIMRRSASLIGLYYCKCSSCSLSLRMQSCIWQPASDESYSSKASDLKNESVCDYYLKEQCWNVVFLKTVHVEKLRPVVPTFWLRIEQRSGQTRRIWSNECYSIHTIQMTVFTSLNSSSIATGQIRCYDYSTSMREWSNSIKQW